MLIKMGTLQMQKADLQVLCARMYVFVCIHRYTNMKSLSSAALIFFLLLINSLICLLISWTPKFLSNAKQPQTKVKPNLVSNYWPKYKFSMRNLFPVSIRLADESSIIEKRCDIAIQ